MLKRVPPFADYASRLMHALDANHYNLRDPYQFKVLMDRLHPHLRGQDARFRVLLTRLKRGEPLSFEFVAVVCDILNIDINAIADPSLATRIIERHSPPPPLEPTPSPYVNPLDALNSELPIDGYRPISSPRDAEYRAMKRARRLDLPSPD